MKTYSPKPEDIEHRWYVIDASGAVLGRLASEVAAILRGKNKPIFAPHMDTGDHVVIVNASKVELTGGKETKKIAYRHSGYPGGIKGTAYGTLMAEKPAFAVEKAIRGMLPKNRLGRAMIKKLHVLPGPEHPHAAQKPVALTLGQHLAWPGLPSRKATKAGEPKATVARKTRDETATTGPVPKPKSTSAKRTSTKAAPAKRRATAAEKASGKPAAAKPAAARAPRSKKKDEGDA